MSRVALRSVFVFAHVCSVVAGDAAGICEEANNDNDEDARKGATEGKSPKQGAHHKDAAKGAFNSQHVVGDACLWQCAHPHAGIHLGGHTPRSLRRAVSASGDACFAV